MKAWLVSMGCVALTSLGCCTNPNNCGSNSYGFGSARVAPPGTSTYSTAATPPYYTAPANSSAANSGTLPGSTPVLNASVPLPPGTAPAGTVPPTSTPPAPNQWQPAGQPNGGTGFYGPTYNPAAATAGFNTATAGSATPYGYQTTTSTAVTDPTRMPAVDATGVRAPVGMVQAGPNGAFGPVAVPGNLEYGGSAQVVGTNPTGYPAMNGGYPYPPAGNSANNVLAQASTKPMESDPNYRFGWRPVDANPNTSPR